jgi:hypothetical protein
MGHEGSRPACRPPRHRLPDTVATIRSGKEIKDFSPNKRVASVQDNTGQTIIKDDYDT